MPTKPSIGEIADALAHMENQVEAMQATARKVRGLVLRVRSLAKDIPEVSEAFELLENPLCTDCEPLPIPDLFFALLQDALDDVEGDIEVPAQDVEVIAGPLGHMGCT